MSWIELSGDDVIADMDGDMATIDYTDGDVAMWLVTCLLTWTLTFHSWPIY